MYSQRGHRAENKIETIAKCCVIYIKRLIIGRGEGDALWKHKVLPIYAHHFANPEGTRGACFVFTDISTSYLTSVKPNLS